MYHMTEYESDLMSDGISLTLRLVSSVLSCPTEIDFKIMDYGLKWATF